MNNFSFPFDVNTEPEVESFFTALSMETDGFYPFGINEFWHGGVHFTAKSSGGLKQTEGVKCVADGEVVAYRINTAHLETPIYQEPEKEAVITPYSTSFTLVRHTLEYPSESGNKLPIFSLYMHLLPWDGYTEGKTTPEYLGKTAYKVKETASDTEVFAPNVTGARGRVSQAGGNVLVLYPRGSVLELGDYESGDSRAPVVSIISGTPSRAQGQTANGYVWLDDLEKQTLLPTFDTVVIPSTAISIKKGELIGYMGNYCTPEMPSNRALLHWEILAGDNLKDFIGQARNANAEATDSQKTVIKVAAGTPLISPHENPTDVSLPSRSVIQKLLEQGDYIQCNIVGIAVDVDRSILGQWNATQRVYTPEPANYPAFSALATPINTASTIPLLSVNTGSSRTVLLPQASQTLWIKKSENITELSGSQIISGTAQAWTDYPENFTSEVTKTSEDLCVKSSEIDDKKTDENGNEWYPIAAHVNNMCYFGYINSNNVTHHAPEEFICFKGVDIAGGSDASIHQNPIEHWRNLFAPITMENTAEEQNSSPFALELHPFAKEVFQHMDGNNDGTLSLSEVQSTLRDPTTQMKVGHLITKHESEWVKSMDRWKYIEQYIPDATRYDWEYEKEKIQNLAWWDDVKGKVTDFPSDDAYYFHPAGFVGNFSQTSSSLEELRVRAFMRMLRVGEGTVGEKGYETLFGGSSFIDDHERDFSDHPRIQMPFGNTTSSAAGAYQVMGYTWDDQQMISKRNLYGIDSFSKLNQDYFCVVLLKHKRGSAWPFLLNGQIQTALSLMTGTYGYSHEWASLPPGRYGQPSKTMEQALAYFDEFLQEELNGETDLHIERGFLEGKFK